MASIDVRLLSRRFDVLEEKILVLEAQIRPRMRKAKRVQLVSQILELHREQIGTIKGMVDLVGGDVGYYAYCGVKARERNRNNGLGR